MERDVLKFLDFEMGNPTTKTFLRLEKKNLFCNFENLI